MKIQILEEGYCNDWNWEKKIAEKEKVYEKLVARMKKCGWKVEYKQVALGTRGSVYSHLVDTLKWLRFSSIEIGFCPNFPTIGARK